MPHPLTPLWSKVTEDGSSYPLLPHLLDTAAVATHIYDLWLRPGLKDILEKDLRSQARTIIAYAAGCHDIGKANPVFQSQPRQTSNLWESIRTSLSAAGYEVLNKGDYDALYTDYQAAIPTLTRHEQTTSLFFDNQFKSGSSINESWLSTVTTGHHGTFASPTLKIWKQGLGDLYQNGGWLAAQEQLNNLLLVATNVEPEDIPKTISTISVVLISGLVILADRIASHSVFMETGLHLLHTLDCHTNPQEWLEARDEFSKHQVETILGIYQGWKIPQAEILGNYTPSEMQRLALTTDTSLLSLMIPTGHGKTEAALLRHSRENERLAFILPTMATSNAMMNRVKHAYKGTSNLASLAHSMSQVNDFYVRSASSEEKEDGLLPSQFAHHSANLLAPITVGTIDQILRASLPGKWTHLRLLALANSHVVIDEVHTMDAYQTQLLKELLVWLGCTNTRVTLLSATLSAHRRQELLSAYGVKNIPDAAFPAIDVVQENTCVVEEFNDTLCYNVEFDLDAQPMSSAVEAHVAWVNKKLATFPSSRIGVICNTVARAQETARRINEMYDDVKVLCFHSRMTVTHKDYVTKLLESAIGKGGNGKRVVIVGTQVIEASLDIDVDFLRTELCPAASLIQRMGRLHRREDPNRLSRAGSFQSKPVSVVKLHEDDDEVSPYFSSELDRVWDWLRKHEACVFPTQSQEFIDKTEFNIDNVWDFDVDSDELAKYIDFAQRGNASKNNLSRLTDDCSLRLLSTLTQSEIAYPTRLVELPTTQAVLTDLGKGTSSFVWHGSETEYLSAKTSHAKDILLGSIPLPMYGEYKKFVETHTLVGRGECSALKRFKLVQIENGFYDDLLGFVVD